MQASRLTLRSNLGYNINDNHGSGGSSSPYDAYTPYIEVHWQRRWKQAGQFTILLPYTADVFNKAVLATLENRDEVGIISKREISVKADGTYITLSGYFAEGALKWGRHFKEQTFKQYYECECLAKYIAETLTSYSSANRDNFNSHSSDMNIGSFSEEGKIQPTGGSVSYYPIVMHCEVGPVFAEGYTLTTAEFDGQKDPHDFVYSLMPDAYSLRAYIFTKADYVASGTSIETRLMPYAWGHFDRTNLNSINLTNTPAFAIGWKMLASRNRGVVFSKANKNIASMSLSIDESDCCSRSAAFLDSDTAWWSSSKPVDRGILFKGDDTPATYKYRGEKDYRDITNAPGYKSSDYGGSWGLGKMWTVCGTQANITKEIKSANASSILAEMSSQAKLEQLNHWREESVEMVPAQTADCQYLTHYDIGEKVTIEIMPNVQYQTYITEVDEVHAKNHVQLTFRTGTPRRVRRW